jgi:predicted NUDIX family NTP pyrophosphohydrolase
MNANWECRVKQSAGILMYRLCNHAPSVLLVHPGGPFWQRRESNAWSIPKGEYRGTERAEDAALREFEEETGFRLQGPLLPLGETVQAAGKQVTGFAIEGDLDPAKIKSLPCTIEWPPRSGRLISFPEVDRAEWFTLEAAREKIIKAQAVFLERLEAMLSTESEPP